MAERQGEDARGRRLSLGTRILIGVLAGVAAGVLLGPWSRPLQIVGEIYVGLLQMTVLPYVVVSLVSRIGSFTREQATHLARHATTVQLVLWGLALALVALMPLSLPEWEAGSFFSTSLVEGGEGFDFLGLYIPTNPFQALAENIVPATVVFSILLGIALIPLPGKGRLLDPLDVVGDALGNIARGVIGLSPWGTFALAAGAVGTASPGELVRLGAYASTFTIGVALLTFVIYPGLVASLSPVGYRELLGRVRGSLLTAFATGKLFAVLPMIVEEVRALIAIHDEDENPGPSADVLVPLAYPFPNAGKILGLLFVPFAAWFIGHPFGGGEYALLLSVGLLSFFGSPAAAIPFLLGLFRMPADLVTLFLVSGIWGARVGDVLGAMHLTAFSLLTATSERGRLRVRPRRAAGWLTGSVAAVAAGLWINHTVVSWSIAAAPPPSDRVVSMGPFFSGAAVVEIETAAPNPSPRAPGERALDRIRRTGVLRVGFLHDNPPFSYRNHEGAVVGLEIDLLHRLAVELESELRLVPYHPGSLETAFAADHFDAAVGGLGSRVRLSHAYRESDPYLELHAAFVVPDHRVEDFDSLVDLRAMGRVRVGFVESGTLVRTGRHRLPGFELVSLPSADAFLRGTAPEIDALLTTAEVGAIHSMTFPEYSVVVPEGLHVRVPTILAVTPDDELARAVDRFVRIKRADGTVETLYEHWILGAASVARERRWSVVKDVFGWAD